MEEWMNTMRRWKREKVPKKSHRSEGYTRGVYNRRDETEERIAELKDKPLEFTQSKGGKKTKTKTPHPKA